MGSDEGSASVNVLSMLLLVTAAIVAGGFAVSSSRAMLASSRRQVPPLSLLESLLNASAWLEGDTTPNADSHHDLSGAPVGATVEDVSSRVNPNWVRKQILQSAGFAGFLSDGGSAQALQQYRFDNGFSMEISTAYASFFSEEGFLEVLTPYSYPNVNWTDEFALERLCLDMTGDGGFASSFHAKIQSALEEKRQFAHADLAALFGEHSGALSQVLTTEAQININFVDPEILKGLLAYPAYGISNPGAAVAAVLSTREARELTIEEVWAMLGLGPNHPLAAVFGDDTWFWRISAVSEGYKASAVFARALPPLLGQAQPATQGKRLRLVELVIERVE